MSGLAETLERKARVKCYLDTTLVYAIGWQGGNEIGAVLNRGSRGNDKFEVACFYSSVRSSFFRSYDAKEEIKCSCDSLRTPRPSDSLTPLASHNSVHRASGGQFHNIN